MNPQAESSEPTPKERRRIFLSRALLLGAIAGALETLSVLTTGTMRPLELGFNFALLVAAFGGAGVAWLTLRRVPLLNRFGGEAFLLVVAILMFALRGCLHNCGNDVLVRVGVPVAIGVASLAAHAWLRRAQPTRGATWFVVIATAAMTLSAIDFAIRDGNVGNYDTFLSVGLSMGPVAIVSSLVVQRGWVAKLGWTCALGVLSVLWAGYRAAPLRIEPAAQRASTPEPPPAHPPNVIVVVLDTVRADHLSFYGYTRPTSPNLDALAKESLVFDHAIASGNYSLSSHASLLTGLLPAQHGAFPRFGAARLAADFRRIDSALATDVETMATRFRSLGFTTGGASANSAYLAPWTGLQRGFEVFDARRRRLLGYHPFSFPFLRRLAGVTSLAQEQQSWEGDVVTESGRHFAVLAREPFLLFLNYFDPHAPYRPRAGHIFRGDGLGSDDNSVPAYDSEIAFVDEVLGQFVDALRKSSILDRTILVITADHGEFFGEHGFLEHRVGAYEDVLHVPLLVRYPDRIHAGRVGRAFGIHEVNRLVTDLVHNRSTDWVYGGGGEPRVLAQVWGRVVAEDAVAGARGLDPDANVVYMDSYKLIARHAGADLLFNLSLDPRELHNLLSQPSPQDLALQAGMRAVVGRLPPTRRGEDPDASAEDIAALRGLGYISLRRPGSK